MMRVYAFIPARSGSVRVKNKNIMDIEGHPLIAYAINEAIQSGVFGRVIVSTDSQEIADIAIKYGAEVPFLRNAEAATSTASDIEWVLEILHHLEEMKDLPECYSILRPTSPLRTRDTIIRAWKAFSADSEADSLRAVEPCSQHPAKMWKIDGKRMNPVIENPDQIDVPWHSQQYAALPAIYEQNASLEISRTEVALRGDGIAGTNIMPFVSEGYEGFDINYPKDVIVLKYMIQSGEVSLPNIE